MVGCLCLVCYVVVHCVLGHPVVVGALCGGCTMWWVHYVVVGHCVVGHCLVGHCVVGAQCGGWDIVWWVIVWWVIVW